MVFIHKTFFPSFGVLVQRLNLQPGGPGYLSLSDLSLSSCLARETLPVATLPLAQHWILKVHKHNHPVQSTVVKVEIPSIGQYILTFILLMWTFGQAPNNASKWEKGFNLVA
jgi:hypothetical protein